MGTGNTLRIHSEDRSYTTGDKTRAITGGTDVLDWKFYSNITSTDEIAPYLGAYVGVDQMAILVPGSDVGTVDVQIVTAPESGEVPADALTFHLHRAADPD